jgi:hypothetical protein
MGWRRAEYLDTLSVHTEGMSKVLTKLQVECGLLSKVLRAHSEV